MTDPMSQSGPKSRPGGARWCEQHRRWECTKQRTKQRGDCHNIAVSGTAACLNHGGESLEVMKAKGEARITAFSAIGATPGIDPGYAVLASLHMAWMRLHLYARLLEEQVEHDAGAHYHGQHVTPGGSDSQESPEAVAGLIGHTYAADKQAGIFAASEAQRALVGLESAERDRVVRFAKVAHDMGIAEREVRLAEKQGELLASVIRNVLGDLDLTPLQQERVPDVVGRHLRAVAELEAGGVG